MTQGTQLQIIPADFQLPAHLQGADAAAAIAKYNAEAAGGIKIGGFPRISIKGSKFHIKEGGETTTIMAPLAVGPDGNPLPGQVAVPLMALEAVIVGANPAVSKTYYPGEYAPGDDKEPTCSADDGVTPDAHIVEPQSSACATCPQNQWGSKVSKMTGKDVKACQDNKRLAILSARDLTYKALGINVTPSALNDWGRYVSALSERNIPVNAVVTNITFDATVSHPKNLFTFGRMLTAEEYAKVQERAKGDDVKAITTPLRQAPVPRLAAPAAAPTPAPATPPPAQVPPPAAPPTPAAPTGFGAAPAAPVALATPAADPEPAKRTRAPRKPKEDSDPLSHLPDSIRATVALLGADSELGKALLAKYPAPAAVQTATPTVAAPVESAPAAAPTGGFGATVPAAPTAPTPGATAPVATPVTSAAANSLKAKLQARLTAAQTTQSGS